MWRTIDASLLIPSQVSGDKLHRRIRKKTRETPLSLFSSGNNRACRCPGTWMAWRQPIKILFSREHQAANQELGSRLTRPTGSSKAGESSLMLRADALWFQRPGEILSPDASFPEWICIHTEFKKTHTIWLSWHHWRTPMQLLHTARLWT